MYNAQTPLDAIEDQRPLLRTPRLGNVMVPSLTQDKQPVNRTGLISIGILILGILLALGVTTVLMVVLMQPEWEEVLSLINVLARTSLLSVAVGFLIYFLIARISPSLTLSLSFAYIWAAFLIIFNVWYGARLMFFEPHDFTLALVLLVFAAIIASAFGISVTSRTSRSLKELALTSQQVAVGELDARVKVIGKDEVGRTAEAFNQMASQLQQVEKERQELAQLRRDLIAWTSHDLRTPLTSIRAMVEALNDGLVTDEETVDRYYRTIRGDILALNRILDDLFELAQMEAGGLELDILPHAIADLISDTLERFHALAQQKGITLQGEVERPLGMVELDALKVSRVLSNLVNNALNYTPAEGEVTILAEKTPTGVRISVADTGPGFPEEELERVFEEFYRGEEARSRHKSEGAGLGLAIARGIVDAHHGRIWATNRENGGAVVIFELPEKQA